MTAPVFLAVPAELAPLQVGDSWTLTGPEGRHAGQVQRLRAGEVMELVDGQGLRLTCEVTAVTGPHVDVRIQARTQETAPSRRLILVQALAKGDRDELAIEAATEVGVDVIYPWQAERSVSVWRAERAAKGRARWEGIVRAATKQSRRAFVPPVHPHVDTPQLADLIGRTLYEGGTALVLDGSGTAIGDVDLPAGDVVIVVGPEGGISAAELESLTAAGAIVARLGPHVLRTSTAGPVAIAVLAQRAGRWQ